MIDLRLRPWCSWCGQPIHPDYIVWVKGAKYHPACYRRIYELFA